MKTKYETLDDYLDALDLIKENVAAETQGMTEKEIKAYFAGTKRRLEKATGQRVRVRRRTPGMSNAKR
jgi:hypothetical protein